MQNEDSIREIATRAFCEVLREKSQDIAADIAHRLCPALASQPSPCDRTKELRDAAMLIVGSGTTAETLEALLSASSTITPNCGLLILRGTQATGWSCHGLAALDNFKRATLDCTRGIVQTVITAGTAATVQVSELDPVFTATLGLQSSAQVLLVPVLLKQKVAALIIALPREANDLPGLELLVQIAQLTLDLQAYRKLSCPDPVQRKPEAETATTTAVNVTVSRLVVPSPCESGTSTAVAPVLDEAHEKARRFAKLLVEEIKLYNQAKVSEGRSQGNLYSRLREDIEKSRAAYQKRYGESAKDVDFFTQELIRILTDNNPAMMGPEFPS
ncbi:MAG: hypothetical protein CXZ00_02880 [Acidobacteria bacterium]|nr:MAG: hypothetical protein CXZ00_02880 [Acidobacteriota bacterium]